MGEEYSESNDELRKLYDSFCEAIERGDDLMEFSSDDLLDVIDYCVHGYNVSIAGEAIFEGLRRNPHDLDFIKRKGFMYHELDESVACERIFSQLAEKEFVRIALELRDKAECHEDEIDSVFSRTLSAVKKGSVEDWDIVFMIDIFDDLGMIDIIVRHADEISRLSRAPEVIYSELYNLFNENGHYREALEAAKKMCDVNAFDGEAWAELANIYMMKFGDRESAVECAEYALAINPDFIPALMIKAIAIYESNPQEAHDIVWKAYNETSENHIVTFAMGCIDLLDGNDLMGVYRLNNAVADFEKSYQRKEVLDLALRNFKEKEYCLVLARTITYILRLDSDINVLEWIEQLKRQGAYIGALCIVMAIREIGLFDNNMIALITSICEVYYRTEEYEELVDFVSKMYPVRSEWMDVIPGVIQLLYALALYRLGRTEELKTFLNEAIESCIETPNGLNVQELIFLRANRQSLIAMRQAINSLSTSVDESLFDPFAGSQG